MKILGSLLILVAVASGCAHRTTTVYEPSGTYVVTSPGYASPAYVVTYDNKTACESAGGHWSWFSRTCRF
jgi:hypothetical protein